MTKKKRKESKRGNREKEMEGKWERWPSQARAAVSRSEDCCSVTGGGKRTERSVNVGSTESSVEATSTFTSWGF